MLKSKALELLGGSPGTAAAEIGVSPSAVSQWPEELPPRIRDRVLAALARKHLPAELLGEPPPTSGEQASLPLGQAAEGEAAHAA